MKDILDINDLTNEPKKDERGTESLKEVSINEIAPMKQKSTPKGEAENQFLKDIDTAAEKFKKVFAEDLEEKIENIDEPTTREKKLDEGIKKFSQASVSDILHNQVNEVIETKEAIVEEDIDNVIEKEIIIDEEKDVKSFNTAIKDEREKNIIIEPDENSSLAEANEFDDEDFKDILEDDSKEVYPEIEGDTIIPYDYDKEKSKEENTKALETISGKKDIDDEEPEDADEEERKEKAELLKKEIRSALNPITKPIDLTATKVVKKPISVNALLSNRKSKKHVTDWVLMDGKKNFSIEAFSGIELEKLDSRNREGMNTYRVFMRIFREIFDHIVNYKDKLKLIEWLKSTNFFDLNHIWFSVYKGSCEKSNILPYTCTNPKCKKSFIKVKPIMDMVKFKDDAARKLFNDILNGSMATDTDHKYTVKRKQIADDLVIDLREPSIWNILFENALLPDKLREKYAILLNAISFIDAIYYVDEEDNLVPLEYKTYPDDYGKEAKSKVYTYGKILSDLTSEEKLKVDEIIKEMAEGHDEVSYVIPEATCEECGTVIEETPVTGEELVTLHLDLADMTLS